jgi:hypothetical protein
MATVIFIGGPLDLAHVLYPVVLFAMVAAGVAFYAFFYRERPGAYRWRTIWGNASPVSRLLIVAALLILFARVAGTVRLGLFDIPDDSTAYLVFPQKMLAAHHFAADPFSDRRIISSVGGGYLLQAFVLAATSLANVAMADRTLGLLLLAAALFDLGTVFGLSTFQIALMEFLACLVPQMTINLTFVVLPTSLFLGMVWMVLRTVEGPESNQTRYAFAAGAIGGAAIALKSTNLPMAGALALVPYLFFFWRKKKARAVALPLLAGLGALVVLAAWMYAMKQADNTYLFPVLGHGLDYSSYGVLRSVPRFYTARSVIKVFLQAIALLTLAGVQLVAGVRENRPRLSFSVLIASTLAITAFNYESGGDFIWRYNFPQFFCAVLVFYAATASMVQTQKNSSKIRLASYAGIASLACMIFYYDAAGKAPMPFRQIKLEIGDYQTSLRASLSGVSLAAPAIENEYRAVEASIPDNGIALENVAYPYLFNYRERKILVMDWPGAAGPPPGWPFGNPPDRTANYLLKDHARYLIYDRSYAAKSDALCCLTVRDQNYSHTSTELYKLWWMSVLANNQFDGLRSQYHALYDDGRIVVLDLEAPVPNAPSAGPVWTFDTDKDQMCSTVMARYLASQQ